MVQSKQSIRIRFGKQGDIRFISHHDLMRLFGRALRRAEIPVAMSEGFNPRPRISFPMALGVGVSGRNEVADVSLREWVRPEQVRSRLQMEFPPGIEIRSVEVIPRNANRQPEELSYRVPLLPGHALSEEKLHDLLSRDSVIVTRRRKGRTTEMDVRPFVDALRLEGGSLLMLLRYTARGTARPQEVLEALGCQDGGDYLASAIERTHVKFPSSA